MSRRFDRTTELALASLLALADAAGDGPSPAALEVKALLWLLYQRSTRCREPYQAFWATLTGEIGGTQAAYVRRSYLRTQWYGIVRSLHGNPESEGFQERLRRLALDHAAEHAPGHRRRAAAIAAC